MPHGLFASLDELLSPEVMSRLGGQTVTRVCHRPWTPPDGSASGSLFLAVETATGTGEHRRYVVKRTSTDRDITMRVTGDHACREMLVWREGLLDRLPPQVAHPIVACAADGEGWAILMRDVGATLQPHARWPAPGWGPLTTDETACLLDAIAALHAHFWQDRALLDPALDLCSLPWLYTSFSPGSARREAGSPHRLVTNIREGWRQLEALVAPDVARLVRALQEDPQPLCDALAGYPWTLVHGDPKRQNVGLERGAHPRVVLLDWQFATRAPPSVDLAWLLSMFAAVLPISKEEAIARYRDRLATRLGRRFDERWWGPQLELALLGQFLRRTQNWMYRIIYHESAWVRDHYRDLLTWWSEQVRVGAKWL